MKVSYFSRRLLFSSGGGEQCDYYLVELINLDNKNQVKIISESKNHFIKQSSKRNTINKIYEEFLELIFYIKNIKFIIQCDYLIITGRSLSAALISLIRPNKVIHNIHGKTNKIALLIFKISNPILFFWGNSYQMNKKPPIKRALNYLIPSSYSIRKYINNPKEFCKKESSNKSENIKIL